LANLPWVERELLTHKAIAFVLREPPAFVLSPDARREENV